MTKDCPTFSIITITLNNFRGLQKTHRSVQNQSLDDIEWIVIDGGSRESTLEFLRKKRTDSRGDKFPFQFISEKDQGIYDAMNSGIKMAKGRYLLFLNAGDMLAAPHLLRTLRDYTDKKPDFIYGDARESFSNQNENDYKQARRYKDLEWGMITHHQAMLYRRAVIRDHQLRYSLIYDIASDYDFTARFLQKSKKIAYFPHAICVFEMGGISQQKAFLGRKEQYLVRENLKMVSQARNFWILCVQTLSWYLRRLSPDLYYKIKRKFVKNPMAGKAVAKQQPDDNV